MADAAYVESQSQYDRQGRLLKTTTYKANGKDIKHVYHYRYTDSRRERYRKLLDGTELVDQVEGYDFEQRLTSRINYNHEGMVENKLTIDYNGDGEKLREAYYENDGAQLQLVYAKKYQYYYLENGILIRANYDHAIDGIHRQLAVTLGENKRIEECKIYDREGPLVRTIKFEHSPQGRLLSKQELNGDDTLYLALEYEYEEAKMYTSTYSSSSRELVERVMYQYEYYQ